VWAIPQDIGGRYVASTLAWSNMGGNFGASAVARVIPFILGTRLHYAVSFRQLCVTESGPGKYGFPWAKGSPVAPRHPFSGTCGNLRGMPHQLHQVVERVHTIQLACMNVFYYRVNPHSR
jgi:hypothetical protein